MKLAFPLLLAAFTAALPLPANAASHSVRNDIPPRRQWNENSGYCGEVCFISAGLYYGQYLSQYDARATIGLQNNSQILPGFNDLRAAARMHLQGVEWNPTHQSRTPAQFFVWIKRRVAQGWPVAIGLYNNEFLIYGNTDPAAGDPTYDHIVSVVGISSDHPLHTPRAFDSDTIVFSDNGLWGTGPTRRYFFPTRFATFPGDRAQANSPSGPVYTLPDAVPNYGIAFKGIVDLKHETLPVRVRTNINYESPQIKHGSNKRPPGRPVTLTITVSGLRPGVNYNLYRYDELGSVPDSDFNAHRSRAKQTWKIQISSGTTYTLKQTIDSNEVAVYRAVRAEPGK